MTNGSREREHPRDVQCCHCGRFYRNDGIQGHEENCPYSEVDDTVVPLADDGGRDPTPTDTGDGASPPQDGEGVGADPTADTVADGGPQKPPDPDVDVNDQDDQNDLPEKYVDITDYIDAVKERPEPVDIDKLRAELSEYDVIDLEQTEQRGTLVAFEREEVA